MIHVPRRAVPVGSAPLEVTVEWEGIVAKQQVPVTRAGAMRGQRKFWAQPRACPTSVAFDPLKSYLVDRVHPAPGNEDEWLATVAK